MEFEKKLEKKAVDTGRGEIVYFAISDFPGRPTVVFLHGLSSNHTTWLDIMRILHEKGYNSLALDLRGHGFSDKTKKRSLYKLSVFTDDLKFILDKENIKKVVLVGYSFGGPIALDYTIKCSGRVAGLILISANHTNPLEYRKIKLLTPLAYGFLQMLSFLLLWQKRKRYYYYKQGESRGYWDSVWMGLNTMPLSVNFWMLSEMGRMDLRKAISQIEVPTLIIRGKNDPFVSKAEADDMSRAISKSEIITFQNPSHFIGSRSQDELSEVIFQFLEKIYCR